METLIDFINQKINGIHLMRMKNICIFVKIIQLYVCGGYDDQDDKYMNMCQNYTQKGMPWSKGDCRPCRSDQGIHLKQKRGFHSMVVVEKEDGENVMLALGGYNGDNFLDSIEKYDPTGADGAGAWDVVAGMKMNETRSHFCAVYYRVIYNIYFVCIFALSKI